jgi:hypothetical protein
MRTHDVGRMSASELQRARRELAASLALSRPDSPIVGPTVAHMAAIDAELAARASNEACHWPACKMTRPNGQVYCDEGRNCNG